MVAKDRVGFAHTSLRDHENRLRQDHLPTCDRTTALRKLGRRRAETALNRDQQSDLPGDVAVTLVVSTRQRVGPFARLPLRPPPLSHGHNRGGCVWWGVAAASGTNLSLTCVAGSAE